MAPQQHFLDSDAASRLAALYGMFTEAELAQGGSNPGACCVSDPHTEPSNPQQTPSLRPEVAASLRNRRVLVVDDNGPMRDVLKLMIREMAGGEVETCRSGQEALALLELHAFDAVLLDLRMPGLSGEETFRRMPEQHQRRVVFISGDSLSTDTGDFLATARQPALFKPLLFEQLVKAILSVGGK